MQRTFSQLDLIGYASGIAGGDERTKDGPEFFFYQLARQYPDRPISFSRLITEDSLSDDKITQIAKNLHQLRQAVEHSLHSGRFFTVVGGDHSCGMGTWSAVSQALKDAFSLIWIDAHIDAHTFETSPSQNIHGMPVAHLLGIHSEPLSSLYSHTHPIHPSNLYLIGIRSYEPEEIELLSRLGVRVYFMEEVQERGLECIVEEVLTSIRSKQHAIGISVDIDAFDPLQMPGTGLHVEGGLCIDSFLQTIRSIAQERVIGLEIAEYNPHQDTGFKTAKKMIELLELFLTDQPSVLNCKQERRVDEYN